MHHANHFYGHAAIMARYAQVVGVPRIWGYLQHGWNLYDGFAVGTNFVPGYPKLVWTPEVARRGWSMGRDPYEVVGSAWSYLLRMEDQAAWDASSPERTGTIVYPFHGWEQQRIIGSHSDYMRLVREVEGDVPITVCLYWAEYQDEAVRREYEELGARVITHGQRGHMWKGTDERFLYKELAEMRRHARVVSNRASSAIFYGASTGASVGVYGDPMLIEADRAVLGGPEKPRRLFPELYQTHVPLEISRALADAELGERHLLEPADIRQAFGWTHQERAA